jgi:hypothetical protein
MIVLDNSEVKLAKSHNEKEQPLHYVTADDFDLPIDRIHTVGTAGDAVKDRRACCYRGMLG